MTPTTEQVDAARKRLEKQLAEPLQYFAGSTVGEITKTKADLRLLLADHARLAAAFVWLAKEYRASMNLEVIHSWGADVRALLTPEASHG